MNLAIFDFCETIIKYQTADKFVDFLYCKSNTKSWFWGTVSKFLGNRFLAIFMGKFFPKMNFGKRAKLIKLKGIDFNEFQILSKLYAEEIQTDAVNQIVEKIEWHKSQGHFLIIVSGGYECYLNHFKEIMGFDEVIGTKIKILDAKVTGYFNGPDCMVDEKVIRINEYLKETGKNFEEIFCYTDSITDLPILNFSNHPIVVSFKTAQNWATNKKFEQIIWH